MADTSRPVIDRPVINEGDLDDALAHLCCIYCLVSACGAKVPNKRTAPDTATRCVVCRDLEPSWVHACSAWMRYRLEQ